MTTKKAPGGAHDLRINSISEGFEKLFGQHLSKYRRLKERVMFLEHKKSPRFHRKINTHVASMWYLWRFKKAQRFNKQFWQTYAEITNCVFDRAKKMIEEEEARLLYFGGGKDDEELIRLANQLLEGIQEVQT